ncbi:uncharacterized protein LOC128501167 [Spea bombifrons]|uniref:uncharacterized protein LOC128501167 n=1 Tax=Spea bombifrons TaxID=233779 RepID=UPI002349A201|nr:uncharacterized protein LOC128501167 [Spea bombifrons]
MHKEHLAQDENSNPREGPGSRKKDRLSPSEHDMNQLNRSRAKTGSWESNGFGPDPEIEALAGRAEESAPLSPSNSLNLRHLRGCEKELSGRHHQRSPSHQFHPNHYASHHHHYRPFYSGYHRKGYWDYESQYRDGKRKEWVPRPGGRPQRHRTREALNATEGSCPDARPEHDAGERGRTAQGGVTGHNAQPAKGEPSADGWVLFKPLPVFPVGSSSARTLPKISYASKVKENLDGKGLVPSSALRTSNSLPNCLDSAQAVPHSDAPCSDPAQSAGSLSSSSCSSLSSSPPSPVSQENLGAIFQNEWGLSFINEPGAGHAPAGEREPPGGAGEVGADPSAAAMGRLSLHGFYLGQTEDGRGQLENPRNWEEMVTFTSKEWSLVWNLHKKDPSRVVVYAESMDGKG